MSDDTRRYKKVHNMMLLINEKSVSHSVECPPLYPTALVEHSCLSTDGRSYVARPGPGGINTEIVASSIIPLVAVGQQVGGERVPRICLLLSQLPEGLNMVPNLRF